MAARMMVGVAVLVIVGIVFLAVGAVIEPAREKIGTTPGLTPENDTVTQAGESLIAIGLTLFLVGLGLFFAMTGPAAPAPRPE